MSIRIEYRKKAEGLEIVRIWGESARVRIPEEIEGFPVVEIAPYAFSNRKQEEETDILIYEKTYKEACENASKGEDRFMKEPLLLAGERVTAVYLPKRVRAVGNYAFYGCMNLSIFAASDRIVRMGSGVFTGCRLSEVELDFYDGEKSCLKEILTEIRYEIIATLRYKAGTAKVIFPEYYADAVENTPARIVETHYYGSGGDYRECFYRRELDYLKYDSMFALSQARDEAEATMHLAFGRLLFPYRLSEEAGLIYEAYVRSHIEEIGRRLIGRLADNHSRQTLRTSGDIDFEDPVADPLEILQFCCREQFWNEEAIVAVIEEASKLGISDALSLLMDERQRSFPRKKKVFEW